MPNLAYGLSAYRRDRGNLPELPLVNMFVEKSPTEPQQIVLQSRAGLSDNGVTSGSGPVTGIFRQDGVFSGALFTVAGANLYRAGVSIGAVAGTGPVSIAGNEIGLAATAGGTLRFYNGTTIANADFPDGASVRKVVETGGRFIALRDGTQKYYWTDTLESALVGGVLTFDALSFASAENEPDELLDVLVTDDTLVLLGRETVEVHAKTGDSDLPYVPIEGRVFDKGVRATGCAALHDNGFAWIWENIVYVAANQPVRVSDSGIEERIAASATCKLFSFFWEGHEFLAVRLDSGTWARDAQSGEWCEFASYGESNWICNGAVQGASGPIFSSGIDGKTYVFNALHADLGGVLERRFRGGFALEGGVLIVNNLRLRVNVGHTPNLSGDYSEPVVELRTSRDAAQTWSNWSQVPLGAQGKYRTLVEWRRLGMFDAPGMVAEFRCTDPVPFRVSGATFNDQVGGRSR